MNPPHTKINENVTQSGFSLYSVNEGLKEQFSIISRVCTYVGKKQHRSNQPDIIGAIESYRKIGKTKRDLYMCLRPFFFFYFCLKRGKARIKLEKGFSRSTSCHSWLWRWNEKAEICRDDAGSAMVLLHSSASFERFDGRGLTYKGDKIKYVSCFLSGE